MEYWYSEPERNADRVSYSAASDRADLSDPYAFHQGDRSPQNRSTPTFDPYDFNQGGSRVSPRPTETPDLPPTRIDSNPGGDVPLPPLPDLQNKPREVKLPDGASNVMDSEGRIILTASADGSKTREVRYGDQSDPSKITQVTIDHNRVYTRNPDGRSWTYEVDGQPAGTWYGDIHMSAKGEYSFEDDRTGDKRKFAANTAEIRDNTQPRPDCPDGNCNQPAIRGGCYDQTSYNDGGCYNNQRNYYDGGCNNQRNYYDGGCSDQRNYYYGCPQGYASYRPYHGGGQAARFGAQVLSGMASYGMHRYAYPGYYPGYYSGGNMLGQVIGRAIFGGHRRW
jgi:hypothetical protein